MVKQLADDYQIPIHELQCRFKQQHGCTVYRYIQQLRVIKAPNCYSPPISPSLKFPVKSGMIIRASSPAYSKS